MAATGVDVQFRRDLDPLQGQKESDTVGGADPIVGCVNHQRRRCVLVDRAFGRQLRFAARRVEIGRVNQH